VKKVFILLGICLVFCLFLSNKVVAEDLSLTKEEAYEYYQPSKTNFISTNVNESPYKHNEVIRVDFSVIHEGKMGDYSVEFKSDAISLEKKCENVKENFFSLSFSTHTSGEFEIEITAQNSDFIYKVSLFIFSTDDFDFVSDVSITEAKRNYFKYLYNQKKVIESQYNEIVYGYKPNTDINDVLVENPDIETKEDLEKSMGNIYVYGYIKFTDLSSPGIIHPAQGVQINLYDEDLLGIRQNLGTEYTDSTGFYWFTVENDMSIFENGYDIILEIKFKNADFQVQDSFQVYEYEFGPYVDVENESYLYINKTFNNSSDHGVALNLHQASILGYKYLSLVDSDDIDDYVYLGIEYPVAQDLCWYLPGFPNIYFGSSWADEFIWDNLLHEFGHYVADVKRFTAFWPASHSMEMNLFSVFGKQIGINLAWSEAWAHYFAVSCQVEQGASALGVPNVGDTDIGIYGLETPNASSYLVGECSEYVLAMLLFDIGDTTDDPGDNVDWGHQYLFHRMEMIVDELLAIDPQDRLAYFHDFYLALNLPPREQIFGDLLSFYYISADLISPSVASYLPPEFLWNKQGGYTYYVNDGFTLYICNDAGQLLLGPIPLGNSSNYILSETEWNTILASGATRIFWNVSASQSSVHLTGPYFSGAVECTLPTQYALQVYVSHRGNLRISGQYDWYKFTAGSTGLYSFYSTGNTDTYADFFNHPVSGTSLYGLVASDNDSGSGTNFCQNLYLEQGQTIFLRVRGNNWTAVGTYFVTAWGPLM
jgi:hypothetical protein